MIITYGTIQRKVSETKFCLNCNQILRVEVTIGQEEYCLGDRGSLAVISVGSDDDIQVFASNWHQLLGV